MVVQWLRFDASNAEDVGLIPCWVTKIAHGLECSQKFQKKKNMESRWGSSDIHLSLRRRKW